MAADSTSDLELSIKKRARRRLVGAIGLVLLVIIILPKVLQDRSTLAPQESAKISMLEDAKSDSSLVSAANNLSDTASTPVEVQAEKTAIAPRVTPESKLLEVKNPPLDTSAVQRREEVDQMQQPTAPKEKPVIESLEKKHTEAKLTEEKSVDKPVVNKHKTNNDSFTIQIGVFSRMENVKHLQAKLKQLGLVSHTEKVTTPKGENIRLKAGTFASRQEAAYALTKIQAANLTGMVISNN